MVKELTPFADYLLVKIILHHQSWRQALRFFDQDDACMIERKDFKRVRSFPIEIKPVSFSINNTFAKRIRNRFEYIVLYTF